MKERLQQEYMEHIQQNERIIHKVIGLYADDEEDRRDLYQEVLLQGWKTYKNFNGRSKFSTWLYKVALNTALTFDKKRQERRQNKQVVP